MYLDTTDIIMIIGFVVTSSLLATVAYEVRALKDALARKEEA